jgi:hypothetical protein
MPLGTAGFLRPKRLPLEEFKCIFLVYLAIAYL